MKKKISILLSAMTLLSAAACAPGASSASQTGDVSSGDDSSVSETLQNDTRGLDAIEYSVLNLMGTDAVGRKTQTADGQKAGTKTVGLFYSLWLGQHEYQQDDVYDVQALLATQEGTEALYSADSELSRRDQFHFCSQPLYGYYNMRDPWVVTRHIELLTLAGIDYLCFDATNAIIYPQAARVVLDTLLKYQKQGWKVPKAMFYTNSFSGTTATKIYNEYYQTETYDDIWWAPNGKPMLIGITRNNKNASDQTKYNPGYNDFITEEVEQFFDVKESQWPNGDINADAIPWMSWQYPQLIHENTKSVSVSVAQHSPNRISFSFKDPQSSRGYDYKTGVVHEDYQKGQNFQNEWDTVHAYGDEVENVLVTSWNEWMAIKTILADGSLQLVDVFNEEYSRDIEMTTGSYGDNFYMQLVQNVRKYKMTESVRYNMKRTNVDIHDKKTLVLWDYVQAKYKDFEGDAQARNYKAAAGDTVYVDNSNRNDIADIRVTHDNANVYFYVKTVDPVTPYNGTDKNWMNIFISTTEEANGFGDYNYVINRSPAGDGKTTVERSTGGYNWTAAGEAEYVVYDNVMLVSVPLSALGLTADAPAFSFKVSDNVTKYDDIMDYYVTGDSAPIGRLSFGYGK